MNTREQLLAHLKRHGPSTIRELQQALGVGENAVRHHLAHLRSEGFIEEQSLPDGDERRERGRPARRYALTLAAEGQFPKRYRELLELVLEQAEADGSLERIIDGVADRLAGQLRPELHGLPPRERLLRLMEQLDYGEMLGRLEATPGGWAFRAYNCLYRDTGCRFEPVCNLLPNIIRRATALPAERVRCQRDGESACHFAGGYLPA